MFVYVLRRLLVTLPTACAVIVIIGLILHIIPGNPVDRILGDFATAAEKAELAAALGLDQPIWTQIYRYFMRLAQGDLGNSLINYRPVAQLLLERVPATLVLALTSIITAILIGIPAGIIAALFKGRWPDHVGMLIAMLGVAIPNFWLGPMLIWFFSIYLDLLPVSEYQGWQSLILPSVTMGTALSALISRMTRDTIIATFQEDFVRTAFAKGASTTRVIVHHVLKNAMTPVVTVIGLQFGVLLTGAVITEVIFDWPGLGSLMIKSLQNRDLPVFQGCVLLFSLSYLVVNLVTDLTYLWLDPQQREEVSA